MAEVRGPSFGSSWVSTGDLSARQFQPLTFSPVAGSNALAAITTSGAAIAGVLQNKPKNREHAAVKDGGHTKLYMVGSIGVGGTWMAGGGGGAVAAGSGQCVGGYVLHAADSGDIAEAFVNIRQIGAF